MDRPITSINKRDVIALLDQVMDRGSPIMANRALAHVRRMLAWCVERGILEVSPAAGVKPPGEEVSRDRVLSDTEVAAIWTACDGLGWPFGPIVQLLILTAQRRDEVACMAWDQLDVDAALWTLPREATKADRAHDVPLSDEALAIIASLPKCSGPLVFSRGGRPPSGFSRAKVRLDAASGVTDWRFHDLRRTAATGLAKMGHPPHVVSAILNHSPAATQGVTAIYQRHRYLDERRAALDVWARQVGRLIGHQSDNVVTLQSISG
jgi:integrase